MDFDGSLEQYDEVIDLMGFMPRSAGDLGGLFHSVTRGQRRPSGTNIWKDSQTFDELPAGD